MTVTRWLEDSCTGKAGSAWGGDSTRFDVLSALSDAAG
ncbi:hypothetical protein I545_2031 [Mycobacterium kansasii 662]|nr:hypothetical protein I545_2031 [Mycobacterium kansasii 662]KEP40036.1 hypothetical protein MKSMC1_48470 [Mycobacterium kansasii]